MLFSSYEFILLFLPVTLLVFFQLGQRQWFKAAMAWLVLSSLFFYGWWNPPYLLLLLASIGVNYVLGDRLTQSVGNGNFNKPLLIFGIGLNLASIGYFKYTDFFLSSLNGSLGLSLELQQIILPLGISFFTFQQIAYLVDAYKGETPRYDFLSYCLFVSFFPQLIAGPIVHHQDVMDQFAKPQTFRPNSRDLAVGLTIFSAGLFKKVMLADSVAQYGTPVFNAALAGTSLTFADAWVGALAYSLQLYFDFSGYSDMAIGISRLFGVKLPMNFNSPYKAIHISDFWRRWHMTLSRFLRDYLYIALGGNRKGEVRRYFNLLATMLLGGLWHGAGWTFVIWGGLHGAYLVLHQLWVKLRKGVGWDFGPWFKPVGIVLTFISVVVSWVFFRAESFTGAMAILKPMAGLNGISLPASLDSKLGFLTSLGFRFNGLSSDGFVTSTALAWVIALPAAVWLLPNVQEWLGKYRPVLEWSSLQKSLRSQQPFWQPYFQHWQWRPSLSWSVVMVSLFWVSVLSLAKESEFIYFQF